VDSTLALGVNMTCPSASQIQDRALDFGDSNITGPSPNTGIPVGNAPLGGTVAHLDIGALGARL